MAGRRRGNGIRKGDKNPMSLERKLLPAAYQHTGVPRLGDEADPQLPFCTIAASTQDA